MRHPKRSAGYLVLIVGKLLFQELENQLLATSCWVAALPLQPVTCFNPKLTGSQLTPETFLELDSVSPSSTLQEAETQKVCKITQSRQNQAKSGKITIDEDPPND